MSEGISQSNIYDIVYEIEGVKDPFYTYPNLKKCAGTLRDIMERNGLEPSLQEFTIAGQSFWNVAASVGTGPETAAVITNYDTGINLFGLNDGALKTAVMIECARLIALRPPEGQKIWFVAASMGENCAPEIKLPEYESLFNLNIWNRKTLFSTWAYAKAYDAVWGSARRLFRDGKAIGTALREALAGYSDPPEAIRTWFTQIAELYNDMTVSEVPGRLNQIGAAKWIEAARRDGFQAGRYVLIDDDFRLQVGKEWHYDKQVYTPRHEMRCQMVDQLDFDMIGRWDPAVADFRPNDREEDRGMIGKLADRLLDALRPERTEEVC